MNDGELCELQNRIRNYESAKRAVMRFGKIREMLIAFAENKTPDDFEAVVFNMRTKTIRFVPRQFDRHLDEVTKNICSLDAADHAPAVDAFVAWAAAYVGEKIARAENEMGAA